MKSAPLVLVESDGERVWHVEATMPGNLHTLCGLALDDGAETSEGDFTGTRIVKVRAPANARCNCQGCFSVWSEVTQLKMTERDFAPRDKRK